MPSPPPPDLPVLSVKALLAHVIDYAGLFPPATLDMASTVRNFAEYVQVDDAWMLERLIVPVDRLDEFQQHAGPLMPTGDDEREPWHISALTVPAGDPRLPEHLERIARFNREHNGEAPCRALVDVIELKAGTPGAIETALDEIPDELFPFFEIPVDTDPRGIIAALVGSDAGAKVRTGGVRPELYPTPDQVARFIASCAQAHVPFKATAGLHHPLCHLNESVPARELGFLNVFVAAALARSEGTTAEDLVAVLTEEQIASFTFDDDGLTWREHACSTEEVLATRQRFAVSFGSCSFDEPREDLRGLGLM